MFANSGSMTDATGSLWGVAKVLGKRASVAGKKGKLKTDLMLLDQQIKARKGKFGMDLYDNLVPFTEEDPAFLVESDVLTNIQGHFVTAYKDNKALESQRAKCEEELQDLQEKRAVAYPSVPCATTAGQLKNASKALQFQKQETTIRSKLAVVEQDMANNKKKFGVDVYHLLCHLEDSEHWLPSDRDVRFFYDQTRRDIHDLQGMRKFKEASLEVLRSSDASSSSLNMDESYQEATK